MRKGIVAWCLLLAALGAGLAVGRFWQRPSAEVGRRVLYYVDPMHPSYRSPKPGKAPDCGMHLEPVYAEDAGEAAAGQRAEPGQMEIDATAQHLYGIRVEKVVRDSGQGRLKFFARVEPDQTRVFRIDMGTDGFVKSTQNDAVGTRVAKDQHLAVVYSPDFLAVMGGYLAANEHPSQTVQGAREGMDSGAAQNTASAQARADRLRNLGMSDAQIQEIGKSRKIPEDVYLVSPVDGYILTRNLSSGMRFERHTELYTIADLSRVWIVAEVFGRDGSSFRPGARAQITLPESGETMSAEVEEVLPEEDAQTHATKVRLVAQNPQGKLRPNMFVNVEIPRTMPPGLSVPADAVIEAGKQDKVFVEVAEGRFEQRAVRVGWKMGDRVEIANGLNEGERVVSGGAFLLDSESRLHTPSGSAVAARTTSDTPAMN